MERKTTLRNVSRKPVRPQLILGTSWPKAGSQSAGTGGSVGMGGSPKGSQDAPPLTSGCYFICAQREWAQTFLLPAVMVDAGSGTVSPWACTCRMAAGLGWAGRCLQGGWIGSVQGTVTLHAITEHNRCFANKYS